MNQRRFGLLCAVMLGFGQLCMFTGFDAESFILESVIHSIHEREPERISSYAGYYGQAVIYAFYMISCLFSPSIAAVSTPKINLILAATFFSAFPLGFLFTNSYYYYASSALVVFYQGQGGYLTSHSTRNTIESNVSISWSVGSCCMILGSAIMATITHLSSATTEHIMGSLNVTSEAHKMERQFGELEINLLFSAFTGISVLGIITFFVMPSKDVENCIESSSEKKETFLEALKLTCSTLVSPTMLQLFPLFVLSGFNTSFWLSVFPTAMSFTMQNSKLIYLAAVYSLGVGSGEVIIGLAISFLSKRIKDFGQKPTMTIGAIFITMYCAMIHMSTPYDAPIRPTSKEPLFFGHSYLLALIIGLFCGIGDCCVNSVRSVICALLMPKRRPQAFSVSKIYHAFGSTILFFMSPITPLYVYTIGLPILAIIATILFFSISKRTQIMERKMTEASKNAAEIGKKLNF
ncbi:UNC93-like protein MFSD11 [Caenorhabditis elegans]|uniref:UNC93-like protein MFSD11 n=1 Tax=Caenorhabditis elegans TaxID=6239 RepID=H2KYC1_CAEEL|nr:UNC93-like protein MFSD11 [Caenorhabditis elegans]CCD62246.1 UNC93-like protein MFSD11 [Caenorhabditis elegans]|eukprot:NP_741503.1 Uncharacterized protein CELE_Y39D8A.1 [Caenorhabditis elegans]